LRVLGDAVEAIQENLSSLALYLVVTVGFATGGQVLTHLLGRPIENPLETGFWAAYLLGETAIMLVAIGLVQAVVFSRLGRNIDRPLWKLEGDLAGIRRYFALWLGLNAAGTALELAAVWSHAELELDGLAAILLLCHALVIVAHIPIGAAIMFLGPFEWGKLSECLRPLWRQLPLTAVVVLFNATWFVLFYFLSQKTEPLPWLRPALYVAFGYVDCVVFAATWYICMFDRQEPEALDLDF